MQFLTTVLALMATSALAVPVSLSYDPTYDKASTPLTSIACSDGSHGLITKYGWKTLGQIPHFPNIGGSSTIPGWNADTCGQCFQVSYRGNSIYVLAVDTAPSGMNIAEAAMNKLTGGQAVKLGRVAAEVMKVGVGKCGLAPKREIEFNA